MAKPLLDKSWISLQEASRKYKQARTSFYLWERKGLLKLKRFSIGRPSVFVNEEALTAFLRGMDRDDRDRAALNTEALRKIWDNEVDAVYDAIDWRTGRRAASQVSS